MLDASDEADTDRAHPSPPFAAPILMPRTPPPHDDDPLAAFELPPEVMSQTFEHAIGDHATVSHELGHAVSARLQQRLKGSTVEFGFPGIVTVHLKSGAVARCGGPGLGWMIDVVRRPGAETDTVEADIGDDERDPEKIADALAKVLRRR
jgi:hypothetical protein